jgi:hypothetical protein
MGASKLNTLIAESGYKTIEVFSISIRQALGMPPKSRKGEVRV